MTELLTLNQLHQVQGRITLPGSKSLSNRALLLAALSQGHTRLENVLRSDDTERMLEALRLLGVKLEVQDHAVEVQGLGSTFRHASDQKLSLFLGNAGTAMRPLTAALALSQGCFEVLGEARMYERPIGALVDALRQLGLDIAYEQQEGYPPLLIKGSQVRSHVTEVDGSVSSQFLSALLMMGPVCAPLQIKVKGELISKPYVDLTCALIEKFGAEVERDGYQSFKVGGSYVSPGRYLVEGDATAATYFMAAAAIAGSIRIYGLGIDSTQGDAAFASLLQRMGAKVVWTDNYVEVSHQGPLRGLEADLNAMPDAAMTLVPLALYSQGPIVLRNIASWRVKETDRLDAMQHEMRKLGIKVETGSDYIALDASVRNTETPRFATYNDHRMAMSLSLCAFDRTIEIENPGCVAKTFPDFFEVLKRVAR